MEVGSQKYVYDFALVDIENINPSFAKAKLRVAYHGENRNKSYITKETFQNAIPSAFNCPIVANFIEEKGDFGSHDIEIKKDDKGEYKIANLTQPIGFIPESANFWWEECVEENGDKKEYLWFDVILWRRQEAFECIVNKEFVKHSMEISVVDGSTKNGLFYINDFYFTAFCLLGEDVEPCYESSALMFANKCEQAEFTASCQEMFKDFKESLAFDDKNKKKEKEDVGKMGFKELLEKYQLVESELDFNYDDMSDEELETKLKEIKFELNSNLREAIVKCLSQHKETDKWGDETVRYYLADFDAGTKEVFVEDSFDRYTLLGTTYEMDGDLVKINFKNFKPKKFVIVDLDEGDGKKFEDPIVISMNEIIDDKVDSLKAEYDKKISEKDEEVINLKASKEEVEEKLAEFEADKHKAEVDAIFTEFEQKLSSVAEFAELKKEEHPDCDVLKTKLFAMVGKLNFDLKKESLGSVGVLDFNKDDTPKPYGNLFDSIEK